MVVLKRKRQQLQIKAVLFQQFRPVSLRFGRALN
jgi:hypothetical protein